GVLQHDGDAPSPAVDHADLADLRQIVQEPVALVTQVVCLVPSPLGDDDLAVDLPDPLRDAVDRLDRFRQADAGVLRDLVDAARVAPEEPGHLAAALLHGAPHRVARATVRGVGRG